MSLSNPSIAPHLAYRFYGSDLVIVMDWLTRRTHILRRSLAHAWKRLDEAAGDAMPVSADITSALQRFSRAGLLTGASTVPADGQLSLIPDTEGTTTLQVVDFWAARNHIPINGSFSVTGKCNLRCVHCYSVHQPQHGLQTDQILAIIDDLKRNGTLSLTLTGGEFFTRPDYREILAYLCRHKFSIRINTNGTCVTQAVAESLADFPQLSDIHVSLYSADAEVHDRITKVRGSYRRTLRALNLLQQTDKIVRINCSVMQSNFESFQSVKTQVGDPLGIPVRYDARLVAMDNGDQTNLRERLTSEQLTAFYSWLLSEQMVTPDELLHPKRQLTNDMIGLCSAGFSYFGVSEDGDLYPCFQLRMPLGSLLKDSFADLWSQSDFLHELRHATRQTLHGCLGCSMRTICNLCIGMSHLEDGDVFGRSSECCRDAGIRSRMASERGYRYDIVLS